MTIFIHVGYRIISLEICTMIFFSVSTCNLHVRHYLPSEVVRKLKKLLVFPL